MGVGVTTFFTLSLFLGVETKRAFPTSVVIAGWTAILPMLLSPSDPADAPYIRLLMIFPGLWFGSIFAPWFSKCGGPMSDLFFYFLFLLGTGTAVVAFAAMAIESKEADINLDVLQPKLSSPLVNDAFEGEAEGDGGEEAPATKAAKKVAEEAARRLLEQLF
jgi:hypothetical protein